MFLKSTNLIYKENICGIFCIKYWWLNWVPFENIIKRDWLINESSRPVSIELLAIVEKIVGKRYWGSAFLVTVR